METRSPEVLVSELISSLTRDDFQTLFKAHSDTFLNYRDAVDGSNLLHKVIERSNIYLFKYIYEKQKSLLDLLNEKNKNEITPIRFALNRLNYDVLIYLIDRKHAFDSTLKVDLLLCFIKQIPLNMPLIETLYDKDDFTQLFHDKDTRTLLSPLDILLSRMDNNDEEELVGNNILKFFLEKLPNYSDHQERNIAHHVALNGDIVRLRELSNSDLIKKKDKNGDNPISLLIAKYREVNSEPDELLNLLRTLYMKEVDELEMLASKTFLNTNNPITRELCQLADIHIADLKKIPSLFLSTEVSDKFNASDYERLAPMVQAMKQCIIDPNNKSTVELITQVLSDKEFNKLKNEKNRIWMKRIFLNFLIFSSAFAALAATATTLPVLVAGAATTMLAGRYFDKYIASLNNARLTVINPQLTALDELMKRSPKSLQAFSVFKEKFVSCQNIDLVRGKPRVL